MRLILLILVIFASAQSFKIPLLFGGISIDRTPKNEIQVGVQRGVNILGNGYDRNTKLAIGDGTFGASDASDVIVGGRRSGPRSSIGLGKDGFDIGSGVGVYKPASARK